MSQSRLSVFGGLEIVVMAVGTAVVVVSAAVVLLAVVLRASGSQTASSQSLAYVMRSHQVSGARSTRRTV